MEQGVLLLIKNILIALLVIIITDDVTSRLTDDTTTYQVYAGVEGETYKGIAGIDGDVVRAIVGKFFPDIKTGEQYYIKISDEDISGQTVEKISRGRKVGVYLYD